MKFGIKILIAVIILVAVGAFGYLFVSKSKISELSNRVDAAILKYDTFGQEVAFRDLNKEAEKGGDTYIFVFRKIDSRIFVHPNKSRIGVKTESFVDEDGFEYGKYIYEGVKKGKKVFRYKTINPETDKEEPKLSYIIPHGDFYFGSGLYNKTK